MRLAFAILALALYTMPAQAEVSSSSPSGFVIHGEAVVAKSPAQAWRALTRIGGWWSPAHTYSGDAKNLTLDARAGGCWCERFGANAIEHARVVMVLHRGGTDTLRLSAALGPLQELAVNGVLTFTTTADPAGTKIVMTYRVSGDPGLNLNNIAPGVDAVLSEQFARLRRYTETGRPE